MKSKLIGLDPFIFKDSEILILGSFPSIVSLQTSFYFMNQKNRLWPILESIYKEKFSNIESKKSFCKRNKIAFFDVIKSCTREGSLDSNIEDIVANDLITLLKDYINVRKIITLGTLSKKLFIKYNDLTNLKDRDIKIYHLPSTSSLNTRYNLNALIAKFEICLKEDKYD